MELVSTGYVDLQVNGFVGVDFNDTSASSEQLIQAAQALQGIGVVAALPTIITAELDSMLGCLRNIAAIVQNDSTARQIFRGIHIEGPFISAVPGYIGAHPAAHAQPASLVVLERLLDAAAGEVRLVTLAPEVDTDGSLTRCCIERGCVVAAGHTDASLQDLERCIDAGMTLFTHLGNSCPRLLDRHDNIIQRALRVKDRLAYTLIADGFHLPEVLFRNLLDWVDHDRLCVISDAISAAGLGPGRYRIGHRQVTVDQDRVAWDVEEEHFVGSACSLRDADQWLACKLGLELDLRRRLLFDNPAHFCSIELNREPHVTDT